ncbi:helix-turn-helix domain-containing protein [Bacteroides salyersiae]|nr:helix-turn-helix domain-containing protein [Bacteroides salyersiae]
MNINKLSELIISSKLNKVQIAEQCGISRTTLDNVLAGSDVKVSTIESLAKVLGVSAACFFDNNGFSENSNRDLIIEEYKKEIEQLHTLLDKKRKSTKVVVELDVDDDEFIKMGLKDKVIQILNK